MKALIGMRRRLYAGFVTRLWVAFVVSAVALLCVPAAFGSHASLGRKSRPRSAARRKQRAHVLAKAPYKIPTGGRATVRAPFTKLGRRQLRQRGRRVPAKISILSMSPIGKPLRVRAK